MDRAASCRAAVPDGQYEFGDAAGHGGAEQPVGAARKARVGAGALEECAGVIEIELESARIRVRGAVDASALRTVLDVLAKP